MNIKTWQERLSHLDSPTDFAIARHAKMESAELRAALQERDAEIERLKQGAHEDGMLRVRYGKQFDAQRKVLEQALEALVLLKQMLNSWHEDMPDHIGDKELPALENASAAITAIQEQLKS